MEYEVEPGGEGQRVHVRPPTMGRMSVFILGVTLGTILGVFGGIVGWGLIGPALDQAGNAARPAHTQARTAPKAEAKPEAPSAQANSQVIKVAAGKPVVIGVFGDSMADGLWAGLYRQLHDDRGYEVVRFSQASTGLARYEYVDVQQKTAEQLQGRHIDIAIVLFGANDEQAIAADGVVHKFESDSWRGVYASRVDALVGLLKAHGAAVYWVGLPKMRRTEYDRKAGVLNAVYEERAHALGIPYVPTVPATVDPQGAYDDYLSTDGASRPKLMRAKDGIHMTMAGYLRIATPVAALVRSDVNAAMTAAGIAPVPQGGAVTLVASPVSAPGPAVSGEGAR